MAKIKKKATVFENPFLETLIKSSPGITAFTYLSIISAEFFINWYYGFIQSWQAGILLYLLGLFFWSFSEYFLHRYLFHWVEESPIQKKFHHLVHGFHHEHPLDEDHLFMPPIAGYLLGLLFTLLFSIVLRISTFVFTAGFITGYMIYAGIHYSTHKFKAPKHLKALWRHHHLHHYRYPDKAFGVSSRLWDYVFMTMPPKPAKKQKQEVDALAKVATETID